MALNAGQAAARVVRAAVTKRQVAVSQEQLDERLTICRACPSGRYDGGRCLDHRCGCFIGLKARLATERCPNRHWPTV